MFKIDLKKISKIFSSFNIFIYFLKILIYCLPELCVVIVSTVSKPSEILAGTALWSIKNERNEITQVMMLGKYI